MKDSFFEMLLNLFETTLSKLKEVRLPADRDKNAHEEIEALEGFSTENTDIDFVRSASEHSIRVLTQEERLKLTKASYQFLMRMLTHGIIHPDVVEQVLHKLFFSDSRFVGIQETKWAIRTVLADGLDSQQLAFLDLILYHKEDGYSLH